MNATLVRGVDFFLERLKERSTWTGVVLMLSSVGLTFHPELLSVVIAAGMAIAGLIEFFWPEPKPAGK
jgi:hypothetical protein